MEGPSDGNMQQEWVHGCLDLQGSMQFQHKQKPCMSQPPSFDLVANEIQETVVIEDDMTNSTEQSRLEHNEVGKSEDGSPWQRMKWTAEMVKLLVTILSYIEEDPSTDCEGCQVNLSSLLRKLGKWKCVSKVMGERGYHVSPQQCEDKFNNLNKTYRRLNDLLGRGTSCKVVENPKLLDMINVSEKGKEDARKMLTSKHLFFEEMCSYHNGNRLYLPHDPDLLQSLFSILKSEDDYEFHESFLPVLDRTNQKAGVPVEVDTAEDTGATSGFQEYSAKWLRLLNENEIAGFLNTSKPLDSNQTFNAQGDTAEYSGANSGFSAVSASWLKQTDKNKVADLGNPFKPWDCNQVSDAQQPYNLTLQNQNYPEGNEAIGSQKQSLIHREHQLEKQKLQLKSKVLKLEKQWFKWHRNSWKQDLELDKMRLENKCLKLENERITMQIKQKRMDPERR
ncbi:hypothetical protein PTKIN_Ptkin10aG0174700 [Pterospermum kingtungense]